MATTVSTVHHTGFEVGSVSVKFGLLWGDAVLFTDWARESRIVEMTGPGGFTETQLLGFGPYKVAYAVFFETIADYRALDALVQQTGTLTVVHGGHTVPDPASSFYVAPNETAYDRVAATLLSLVSSGVAPDGTVEAVATWSRSA